jgi:hypothetical protein
VTFRKKLLYGYGLQFFVTPLPTPVLEDHPLSDVRDCLFNIFAATFHIWRLSFPSASWGRAMTWWQRTHLTWLLWINMTENWNCSMIFRELDPVSQSQMQKTVPSNTPKPIKQCLTKEVRLLELQNRLKSKLDRTIILNVFSYIYFFPFSGVSQ